MSAQLLRGGDDERDGGTWALIVSSSQYWHNYRHTSNALTIYDAVRRFGVPDSQIVLMLAGEIPCDARNAAPGRVVHAAADGPNLYRPDVQADYRGAEVTAETFLRVLSDTVPPGTPGSRRLRSTERSRVLVYLTGHGGDEFFKFRDLHELASAELADGLAQMVRARRCKEVLLLVETCQAASMTQQLGAEHRVVSLSSSKLGQNSYSYITSPLLGVALSDRFTFHLHRALTERAGGRALTAGALRDGLTQRLLNSDVQLGAHGRADAAADAVRLLDFFAEPPRGLAAVAPLGVPGAAAAGGVGARGDDADGAAWRRAEAAAFWGGVPLDALADGSGGAAPVSSGGGALAAAGALLGVLFALAARCARRRPGATDAGARRASARAPLVLGGGAPASSMTARRYAAVF